jgi:signal peptidase II
MKKDMMFLLTVIGVFLADRISKLMVLNLIDENDSVEIISNVLYLNHVTNTGAGFSLFHALPHSHVFLIFSSLIIIGIILLSYDKIDEPISPYIALVVGGATGNLIDRIVYGHVIDFIDIRIWPVFNLADTAISIAGVMILIYILRKDEKKLSKN